MRFLPANLDALLVELDDLDQTLGLLASLQRMPLPGVTELVPAARTVLLRFAPWQTDAAQLARALAERNISRQAARPGALVEIPVCYDGEDLAEVAQILGITAGEVVRRHAQSEFSVAFTGFAPGFAYLSGGDPVFNLRRRSTPRTRVPAGSLALGGSFSAIYPKASPGGWQIIGSTPLAMWDMAREVPALLAPGARVRFLACASKEEAASACQQLISKHKSLQPKAGKAQAASNSIAQKSQAGPALVVRATGLQTLFQDLGRSGQASQGVSASGAMDKAALKEANRLVGNASDSAALEVLGGGLVLQSRGESLVAVTGARTEVRLTTADGQSWPMPCHAPMALADGDSLRLAAPSAGLRNYVAVRGGFVVEPVLGSCSRDTLAEIGPEPLAAGRVLQIGCARPLAAVAAPGMAHEELPAPGQQVVLDVVPGPRSDWFTREALELLTTQAWQVTPQSNRVGLRLSGAQALQRAVEGELPSEAVVRGAIQVPINGQPVLFMADHPLTGGYPVIAAVASYHLDLAGQIPVGAWVRFRSVRSFQEITP
ncbi:5-oxoprolinase subunit B/C family protein [Comamonas composti]|uniref:5-oxoprolinase subunit B/C family protein n=1 Tax=Comamonas composti TaxID=408558 RepID=UPI0004164972|nr:urea amidolyase family protein [Comamonas composti]